MRQKKASREVRNLFFFFPNFIFYIFVCTGGGGGGGEKQKKIGKKKFQWTGNNFVFEDGLKTFLKIPFITTHLPFEKGLPRPLLYTISLRPKTLSERVCCLNAPRGVLYVNRPTNGSPK